MGVEGGSLGEGYRWRARTPGRKEAGRGADPCGRTCAQASHSDVAVAGFGSGDSLSKRPMNPGKRAWKLDAGWIWEGVQAFRNMGMSSCARHCRFRDRRNTLGWCIRPPSVSPWIRPVSRVSGTLDHFFLPIMASSAWTPTSFKRAQPQYHTHTLSWGFSAAAEV